MPQTHHLNPQAATEQADRILAQHQTLVAVLTDHLNSEPALAHLTVKESAAMARRLADTVAASGVVTYQ